jgi:hypothetical protein
VSDNSSCETRILNPSQPVDEKRRRVCKHDQTPSKMRENGRHETLAKIVRRTIASSRGEIWLWRSVSRQEDERQQLFDCPFVQTEETGPEPPSQSPSQILENSRGLTQKAQKFPLKRFNSQTNFPQFLGIQFSWEAFFVSVLVCALQRDNRSKSLRAVPGRLSRGLWRRPRRISRLRNRQSRHNDPG